MAPMGLMSRCLCDRHPECPDDDGCPIRYEDDPVHLLGPRASSYLAASPSAEGVDHG